MSKIVCIDPGHGGRNPGAVGPAGVKEKDIVLKISQKIAAIKKEELELKNRLEFDIKRVEGFTDEELQRFTTRWGDVDDYLASQYARLQDIDTNQYIFTRLDDITLTLEQRVRFAASQKADVFISLHCNGFRRPEVTGTEVFFRARDVNSRVLATRLLISIRDRTIAWINRGVKPNSTFRVLRHDPQIPAALVEFNFITNPKMEEVLSREVTQTWLAQAVIAGVSDYFI